MRICELLFEADIKDQATLDRLLAAYKTKRDHPVNNDGYPITRRAYTTGNELADLIKNLMGRSIYYKWVINQYIQDDFLFLHDIPDVASLLLQFDQYKRDQTVQIERDIGRYRSVRHLNDTIREIDQIKKTQVKTVHLFKEAVPIIEKFAAANQAQILYRDSNLITYQPLTFEASNFLKPLCPDIDPERLLCTIKSKNYFSQYQKNGSLIYTITNTATNTAFVSYISKNLKVQRSEFANFGNDHSSFGLSWQLEYFPKLKSIIKKFPIDQTDFKLLLAIEDNPVKQKEMAMTAVSRSGIVLGEIPEDLIDKTMCLTALKQSKVVLRMIPKKFRDYDMCLTVVNYCLERETTIMHTIPFIKNSLLSYKEKYDLYLKLSKLGDLIMLDEISDEFKDETMCVSTIISYLLKQERYSSQEYLDTAYSFISNEQVRNAVKKKVDELVKLIGFRINPRNQ